MEAKETEATAFDESVARLDAEVFERAAEAIQSALAEGEGLRMWFQPGDATRYLIEVGRRTTITVSNGEPTQRHLEQIGSVSITFGTEGDRQTQPLGHLSRLRPEHGWTAAVWRRLWDLVRTP